MTACDSTESSKSMCKDIALQRRQLGKFDNLSEPNHPAHSIASEFFTDDFPVSAAELRPARAGPAGHHRSMARGAAACMGARWDQAPREATRTRLSMAATLARLLRNARTFVNWYG